MAFKKVMYYIVALAIIVLFIALYVRWFERSSIFFPSRQIVATPDSIGLAYEDVYFKTSDGVQLNGWFVPDGDSPRATVLYCHGNAGNISHRLDIIRMFNSLGLDVFIFDYRGYGRSNGGPSEEGTYLDAQAAYDYLVNTKGIDPERIVIYGKSLGGAVAVDLATRTEVRAVISDSAFTSTVNMGREIYPFLPVELVITMKYDTISKVKGLSMPKLIIHSSEDEIVPFHHGEEIFENCAEPKHFYRMLGGHNDGVFIYEDKFTHGIDEFLKRIGI
ncbi:MAG: alpha/beta hydrolase [Candidatus Omnitrophota bacterium]